MLSNYRDYLQHNILHVKTRITYPSFKYSGLLLKREYLVNLFQAICTSPIHCMLFPIQPTPVVRKIFNKWKFYCQSWQIRRWCRWQLKGSSQKVTWYFFHTPAGSVALGKHSFRNFVHRQVSPSLTWHAISRMGVSVTRTANLNLRMVTSVLILPGPDGKPQRSHSCHPSPSLPTPQIKRRTGKAIFAALIFPLKLNCKLKQETSLSSQLHSAIQALLAPEGNK